MARIFMEHAFIPTSRARNNDFSNDRGRDTIWPKYKLQRETHQITWGDDILV